MMERTEKLQDRVLFIDAEALVIDKPAGLAVHAGPSTRESLEDLLSDLRFGFRRPPSAVHRLDRDTSGCLLLARNPKAHKRFAQAFEEGRAEKSYLAVLEGVPGDDSGRIALPLVKVSSREAGWRMVADPSGKAAVTEWRTIARRDGRTLVLFTPRTGRTHQIRVHAAEGLGHAISGDPVYGRGGGGMLLHALALRVPRDPKPAIEARAPLPRIFVEAGFDDAGL
ncbi:RluA family pseudouridine synthase [Sphingosinicella terrae]|uniref:RluA family pseudouridine synthase n=1 Tax=Sphingosinicella terrae TaxID=2172047 RepID=UPI002548E723|nr:RNA pseudouridine synthase [Sphingosinicella terrae]